MLSFRLRRAVRKDFGEVSVGLVQPLWIIATAAAVLAAPQCLAQSTKPAALIEDVAGVPGVSAFDYIDIGSRIDLGSEGRITLAYLSECREETIEGGKV